MGVLLNLADITPIVPTMPALSSYITAASFQPIIDMILSILPAILGYGLAMAGIRIALKWVFGAVKTRKSGN